MKAKAYISGKITGLSIEDARKNFEQGKSAVEKLGFIPVSPMDLPHNHDQTWESYMKEDLTALLECQAIYTLPNWEDSRGAKIEVELAKQLGIHVIVIQGVSN